jgi:hypothetical protein
MPIHCVSMCSMHLYSLCSKITYLCVRLEFNTIHFVTDFVSAASSSDVFLTLAIKISSDDSTLLGLQVVMEENVTAAFPF